MWREIITRVHRGCRVSCKSCLYFAMCDKELASSEFTKRLNSTSNVGFKQDRPSSLDALQHCQDMMEKSPERTSTTPVKLETLHVENQTETATMNSLENQTRKLSVRGDTMDLTGNSPRDMNSRRADYLQWPEYFMALAFLAAKRSKDPCSQVGACIVDPYHKIVGLGYNGFPTGCSDEEFPWRKGGRTDLNSKYMYVCHAEMNAIVNKISADVRGCTMYVGLFPCAECAKLIIQAGISQVVYMSDKHANKPETIASKRMFKAAGVKLQQYIPKEQKIVIDFSEINWNDMTQVPPSPNKS